MIDLSTVNVIAGSGQVLSFPRTASLTHFGLVPNEMSIGTSGTDGWKEVAVPPYTDPSQAGTLWVFRLINGSWYTAGAERLRKSQLNGTKRVAEPQYGGLSTLIGSGWFGKPEFGILANNNPTPGEAVGFMVVAGRSRLGFEAPVQARTEVIVCEWPGAGGASPLRVLWREGDGSVSQPPPVEPPPPSGEYNPPPPTPSIDFKPVIDLLKEIRDYQKLLYEVWK